MRTPTRLALAAVLASPLLPSCGGGGGTGGGDTGPSPVSTAPTTTTTTTTTTTLPAAPVHAVVGGFQDRGLAPLTIGFVMCDSTDSAGAAGDASNLRFFADFDDGAGLVEQENCNFAKTFGSSGVDRLDLRLCVRDRTTAAEDCVESPLEVAAPIDININRSNNLACQGILQATATVERVAAAQVRAMGAIDRMQFIARLGNQTESQEGQSQGGGTWATPNNPPWKPLGGATAGIEVTVRPFSGDIEGWEVSDARPGCQ